MSDIADHGMGSGLCAGIGRRLLTWVGIRPACVQGLAGGHWPWFGMLPVCRGWQEVTGHELGFSLCAGVGITPVWALTGGHWHGLGSGLCAGVNSTSLAMCWDGLCARVAMRLLAMYWEDAQGWQDVAGHALGLALCAGVGSTSLAMSWDNVSARVGKTLLAVGWEDAHRQGLASACLFRWDVACHLSWDAACVGNWDAACVSKLG
ncbi:hypothetical protein EDC04DRAFT_2602768 [Pisolithus marmoratus]|nr:hypothetical protein EDC04DRAFT_2602768 [Pisolithus marmoratus]